MTFEDITARIHADSQRDIFLQSLTISLQNELGKMENAVASVKKIDELKNPESEIAVHCDTIDHSVSNLQHQIDDVAWQHHNRLKNRVSRNTSWQTTW